MLCTRGGPVIRALDCCRTLARESWKRAFALIGTTIWRLGGVDVIVRSGFGLMWFWAGNFVLAVGVVLKRMRSVYYRVAVHGRDFRCNIAAGDLVLGRVGGL